MRISNKFQIGEKVYLKECINNFFINQNHQIESIIINSEEKENKLKYMLLNKNHSVEEDTLIPEQEIPCFFIKLAEQALRTKWYKDRKEIKKALNDLTKLINSLD